VHRSSAAANVRSLNRALKARSAVLIARWVSVAIVLCDGNWAWVKRNDDISASTPSADDVHANCCVRYEDGGGGVVAIHLQEIAGRNPVAGMDVHRALHTAAECELVGGYNNDGRQRDNSRQESQR
jgi:hypothetical protein